MAKRVKTNHKEIIEDAKKLLREAALRDSRLAAEFIIDYILEKMMEPKTGNRYPIPGTNPVEYYTASAPGEFPAIRTGALADSLRYRISKWHQRRGYVGFEIFIDPASPAAEYAELVAAIRPLIQQALIDCHDDIQKILGRKYRGKSSI